MAELLIRDEARADIAEAHDWYEGRSLGLGAKFLDRVGTCLETIRVAPLSRAVTYRSYRAAPVRKHPYVVYYRVDGEVATVYAVIHSSRNPQRLRKRLP